MKQYSFASVNLIIDGVKVNGMENSQNIVVAGRQSPQHLDQIDARGKMVVSTVTDLSGFIAFNLLHTSDFNVWLSLRASESQLTGTSGGSTLFVPIQALLQDKMGSDLVVGVNGIITQQPDMSRGIQVGSEMWRIRFERLMMVRGTSPDTGV